MQKFILVGYSGHSYVMIDTIRDNSDRILGYFRSVRKPYDPYKLQWLGDENEEDVLKRFRGKEVGIIVAIGDNNLRRKLHDFFNRHDFSLPNVINRYAWISDHANISHGCFVAHGCQINALSSVGKGTILNTDTIIEHECTVGKFVNVSPGSVLLGNVTLRDGAFIGANAVIRQGLTVGENAVVGAGSVVIEDVPDRETWAGNPARSLNRKKNNDRGEWWQSLAQRFS